ncbi:hypothetical protein R1sor_004810 [Riccia sorocarpa]|uniref:NB-ARC domain-containing protein n=1 Tax=Riccia sorocarpa TaxID=122646 RepID=A0ABD3HP73_9MARC
MELNSPELPQAASSNCSDSEKGKGGPELQGAASTMYVRTEAELPKSADVCELSCMRNTYEYAKTDELEVPLAGASESNRNAHEMANKRPKLNEPSTISYLIRDAQRQAELERRPPLMVPKEVVGVKALVAEILGTHIRDHKFVGIWGMGGVGKTTLAKVVFNKMFAKFEYTCFIEDLKQIPRTKEEVKSLVWKEMNHYGVPVSGASGPSERSGWYQVKGKSLLVVLDDVEDSNHVTLLEEIAYENGMEESRFVLTSRNAQRLRNVKTIPLDALEQEDDKKLFTLYSQPDPPESFRKVLEEIVDGCGGLPLTLEVLGRYLKGQEIELWEEIPGALRDCDEGIADLQEKVWAKLQLSYDRLPGSEVKDMFLDIVSIFLPDHQSFTTTDAKMAWSSTDKGTLNHLRILEDRALVTVRGEEFYMHEHLRRMGERIARREGRHLNSDASSMYPLDDKVIFQPDQELGKIVTSKIEVDEEMIRGVDLPNTLVLLSLGGYGSDLVFSDGAGGYLVNDTSSGTLLLTRCFSLVNVELSECKTVDLGGLGELRRLRVLAIKSCTLVRNWPKSLLKLRNLEWLELSQDVVLAEDPETDHERNPRLVILPIWLGDLANLQTLIIRGYEVQSVPSSLRKLTSLRFLQLDRIQDMSGIPNIIGSLRQLQVLQLTYNGILELPDTLGNLTSLRKLLLYDEIKSLPASFSNLTRLEDVSLKGEFGSVTARKMSDKWWPVRIAGDGAVLDVLRRFMTKHKHLLLQCKHGASAVMVRNMVDLESLTIVVADRQSAVPDAFGGLQKLQSFKLVCHAVENSLVESLGRLSSLEELHLVCETLEQLPVVFGCSSTLKTLWIACPSLPGLPETVGEFSQLTTLHVNDTGLRLLPDSFARLSQLKQLHIAGCDYLSPLPKVPESLKYDIRGCDYLTEVRDEFILSRKALDELDSTSVIASRPNPTSVIVWSRSQNPESHPWDSLELVPETICKLSHLQSLSLWHLQKLTSLPKALGDLHSLRKLQFYKCAIESLPESLGQLSSLTHLGVSCCEHVKTLPKSLGRLSSLIYLEVTYCENVKTLPGTIGDLFSLTFLDLQGSAIDSLPGTLSNLSQLKRLRITGCGNLGLPSDIRAYFKKFFPGVRVWM